MIGMLWLDANGERSFTEKVQRAINYFKEKYGRLPLACYVHSLDEETAVDSVPVKALKTILPNHFWLVFEDKS